LDAQIGLCSAPCAGRVGRGEYREALTRLARALDGRAGDLAAELEAGMKSAAKRLDFERAARLRDELDALRRLRRRGKLAGDLAPEKGVRPGAGGAALARALKLGRAPRHVEGVDVANLGGGEAVGAVVTFSAGRPVKGGYRRFRIKTARGDDDPRSIREVVRRRYARVAREGGALPDVLVVDGGRGQLAAARAALEEAGVEIPRLVALAKGEERVYTRPRGRPLRLARRNDALRLLMRVRDEAHRFAGHYHRLLRAKRVLGPGKKTRRKK
jgi:excinuclease ABC subunit C